MFPKSYPFMNREIYQIKELSIHRDNVFSILKFRDFVGMITRRNDLNPLLCVFAKRITKILGGSISIKKLESLRSDLRIFAPEKQDLIELFEIYHLNCLQALFNTI
jgi:hypothetical protein